MFVAIVGRQVHPVRELPRKLELHAQELGDLAPEDWSRMHMVAKCAHDFAITYIWIDLHVDTVPADQYERAAHERERHGNAGAPIHRLTAIPRSRLGSSHGGGAHQPAEPTRRAPPTRAAGPPFVLRCSAPAGRCTTGDYDVQMGPTMGPDEGDY
jgi:hypothetical protein